MEYRHELKFLVSEKEIQLMAHRLKSVMKMDAHQIGNSYMIRSLYFDDINDSCKRENEDGIDNRRKFRIRLYDGNVSVLHLEKKEKHRGMTKKTAVDIAQTICKDYMHKKIPVYDTNITELEKELYSQAVMNRMLPKCIVEYERTAFVDKRGNVRITFDRNISGSDRIEDFLDKTIYKTPVSPEGQHILEIKYDEFLPQYLAELLEIGTLQQTSFSKYYYVREILD